MPFNNPSRMALVLGEGGTTASPETQLPMEPQAGSPGEVTFEQNLEVFWAERKKARSIRPIDHLLGETCNTHSGRGSEKKKKKKDVIFAHQDLTVCFLGVGVPTNV